MLLQVELEGLTGEIRFNDDGRRQNYTLHVVEMTFNSAMVKVSERRQLLPVYKRLNVGVVGLYAQFSTFGVEVSRHRMYGASSVRCSCVLGSLSRNQT
jgi:hypothetical protein